MLVSSLKPSPIQIIRYEEFSEHFTTATDSVEFLIVDTSQRRENRGGVIPIDLLNASLFKIKE